MDKYSLERISLEEGLSQSVINRIIQDREGFMWFATQDGLNRYDGYNFKVFKNDPENCASIPNNSISFVYEDKDGELWTGTYKGLSRYDKRNNCFLNYKINIAGSYKSIDRIDCICEDSDGNFWVGSEGGGLNKFDKIKNEFEVIDWEKNFDCNMDRHITCLTRDSDNLIWIGTWNNGLYIFDTKKNKITNYRSNPEVEKSLSHDLIYAVYEDSRKNILIGTKNGLNIFNKSGKNFESYLNIPDNSSSISGNAVSSICEDKNKFLWIGTKGKGLYKIDIEKKKFLTIKQDITDPCSLSNDTVFSLYCDRYNVLWIGTFGGGINKLDCDKKKFYTVNKYFTGTDLVSLDVVLTIFIENKGTIWIGTFNKGLFAKSNKGNSIANYRYNERGLRGTSIFCIHEDVKSNIWIGTFAGGLNRYNKETDDFTFFRYGDDPTDNVYNICSDKNPDFLWIGSHIYGLLKFDIIKEEFVKTGSDPDISKLLASDTVKALFRDTVNNLWVGTNKIGLIKFESDKNSAKVFKSDISNPKSISDNNIISIYEDENKNLWIGTRKGGLNKFDTKDSCFKKYSEENGLPDNMINSIIEDSKGDLWLSTNNGISRFNPETETFRNYESGDGLQSREFNDRASFKSNDGTIYFGGINGYNYFKPEEIKDNPYIPNIVITDFQIFNHSVTNSPESPFLKENITVTKEIILSYRESVFSFEFAALIYNNQKKNQYAYMMKGFDKEWIFCGTRRQVTYTNLDPGEYTFMVKGSNNDGIWNDEGTSVKITITPPYWKTWWFKLLGMMSIAAATGLTYKQRLDKVKKEKVLQEEFTKKLIESEEDERKRVANELHDSLGQDLLIIKNKALISIKKTDDVTKFREQMSEISELTSSTIDEVREISYNLRPYELDRLGLTKTLDSVIERANTSTEISFVAEIENVDKIFTPEIEINIYRIVKECLTNVIKHSEATEVIIEVRKSEKDISLIVADNGKGFDTGKKFSDTERKGFGLSGIPERVKLFGGSYKIESEPEKGTTIKILIPFSGKS